MWILLGEIKTVSVNALAASLSLASSNSVCAIGVLSDSLLDAIGVSSVGPIMMAAGLTLVIYGGYMLVTYLAARGIVKGSLQQG